MSDLEGGALLELDASGSLVWAQYRDDEGNLVVELPNTRLGAGIDTSPAAGGLLRDVRVESQDNGGRPLTRLRVATTTPVEHALVDDGGTLRLEFYQGDAPQVAVAAAPPARPAFTEPAPAAPNRAAAAQQPARGAPQGITEAALNPPVAGPAVAAGTPDEPVEFVPSAGFIADRLEAVELVDADSPTLEIRGNGEFEYSSFVLENPDRFVLDLKGVVNRSRQSAVEVGAGSVERVRLAQFRSEPDPVSRVVVDLRTASLPTITRGPAGLLLAFGEGSGSAAPSMTQQPLAVAAAVPPPTPSRDPQSEPEPAIGDPTGLPEADRFAENGFAPSEAAVQPTAAETVAESTAPSEGSGRIEERELMPPIEPAPQVAAAPTPAEQVASPESQRWHEETPLEVTESSRPRIVLRDDAAEEPLRIELVGDQERPTAQEPSDVSLFEAQDVRIEPRAPAEEAPEEAGFGVRNLTNERQYFGEPVSLSLRDADITEVLRSFAREFDLNIVIQPGVGGPVTVELNQVPWDQALDSILKVNGLGMDLEGSILRIAPVARLQQEAENEQRLAQARALAVPLTTIMKRVSYATAQEVATILTSGLASGGGLGGGGRGQGGILSQRGSVSVDTRTNTLIIRELPEYLDTVIQIIENLDTPTEQVMIEARIIETTRNFSRTLGINWGFDGIASPATGNTTGLQFPNNVTTDGGVQLLTGGANGFLNLGLGNVLNTFQLDVALQAAEADGLINVISAPKISTLDNISADIQTGLQIPIQTVANNTVSVQFVNATLRLNVTPQVTADGTIQMDIQIQKREPQLAFAVVGATNAPIATREARTRVIVRDGGTAVIGGIYTVSNNQNVDKVPGLANIPVLGHLFKNRNRSNQNEELLIFITPRVIQL